MSLLLDPLRNLYQVRPDERRTFGNHWCGPATLPHAESVLVAQYAPLNEDGCAVDVYATAVPARFFAIKTHDATIGLGTVREFFVAELADSLASGTCVVTTHATPELRSILDQACEALSGHREGSIQHAAYQRALSYLAKHADPRATRATTTLPASLDGVDGLELLPDLTPYLGKRVHITIQEA